MIAGTLRLIFLILQSSNGIKSGSEPLVTESLPKINPMEFKPILLDKGSN
jgi:hypothetical protein